MKRHLTKYGSLKRGVLYQRGRGVNVANISPFLGVFGKGVVIQLAFFTCITRFSVGYQLLVLCPAYCVEFGGYFSMIMVLARTVFCTRSIPTCTDVSHTSFSGHCFPGFTSFHHRPLPEPDLELSCS